MCLLDHHRDVVEVMVGQRLLSGVIDCHVACLPHHMLLSAIALTVGSNEPDHHASSIRLWLGGAPTGGGPPRARLSKS
jgi:hypothetical protein